MTRKILHVATIDFTISKMLLDKMKELEKFEYEVEFMSDTTKFMSDNTNYLETIKNAGFKHHALEMKRTISPFNDILSVYRMYKFFKSNSFEIIHTHTAKAGFIGRVSAWLAKQPIIVHTSHGLPFYEGQSKIKNVLYRFLEKMCSKLSKGYFSQNYEDLEIIKKFVPKHIITGYEGNGIPLKKLDEQDCLTNIEIEKFKKILGIPQDYFVFFMGARFESVKNHVMLIKSLLNLKNSKIKIIFAGNGPLFERIKNYSKHLGVSNYLLFLGYREDIPNLIQISDAVILTSEKEGLPRILMESMAFRKPILATDVLGTRELVEDYATGELVELNDYNNLTKKIENWSSLEFVEQLNRYGENGRKRLEEYFTEAKVAERIDNLYKEIMKG
ncbi:glycosyltransferase family 4 protein [Halobacillus salinarum]|uniref:Glycosyltransferase family 4 protein n=1 Tax=Halobacillus salinarum TaxID=2932257 RepID=A0ABY4ELS3_9BACI|nr:glycosyltransferase family 4 protein [Halobacillus salinarum]UOQ45396.1 glycosyltransferase family 4 protein [Halobacillus salinarum]